VLRHDDLIRPAVKVEGASGRPFFQRGFRSEAAPEKNSFPRTGDSMKTITAEAVITVNSGKVGLTAEQAKTRLHNLNPSIIGRDGSGVYEVRAPIQFKRGEKFDFDGQIGKDGSYSDPAAEEHARASSAEKQRVAVETAAGEARAAALAECQAELREKLAPAIEALPERHRASLNAALDAAFALVE
jgi:hypothetical protein